MANEQYTDEELADLTPEEREALEEDDGTGEGGDGDGDGGDAGTDDQDKKTGTDGDGDGSGDGTGDKGDEDGSGDGTGDGTGEGSDKGGEQEDADQDAPERTQGPLLSPKDAKKAEQDLQAIAPQKDSLNQKFEDGELTASEYQKQLDELNRQERKLERDIDRNEMAKEMAENQARNKWQETVDDFLDDHPEYRDKRSFWVSLDDKVRTIANDQQNANLTGKQILAKAHKEVQDELGVAQQPGDDKGSEQGQGDGGGKANQEASKGIETPPNLGKMPAAAGTEVENSKWAKLDKLQETDPERYEDEIAKLPDDELEQYLASQ